LPLSQGIKLHYVEKGDPTKPLLVFVHGFPEFWYSWRYQIKEFSKDYWTVTIDQRGYGDSEKPSSISDYHINNMADDIRELVRKLGE
jgi:pimeloyl-ACP methyl ester carboxylesterase